MKPKTAPPKKPKPVKAWMIAVCWRNHDNYDKKTGIAIWRGVASTRREMIALYEKEMAEPWKTCYLKGDRCIRVLITPDE